MFCTLCILFIRSMHWYIQSSSSIQRMPWRTTTAGSRPTTWAGSSEHRSCKHLISNKNKSEELIVFSVDLIFLCNSESLYVTLPCVTLIAEPPALLVEMILKLSRSRPYASLVFCLFVCLLCLCGRGLCGVCGRGLPHSSSASQLHLIYSAHLSFISLITTSN